MNNEQVRAEILNVITLLNGASAPDYRINEAKRRLNNTIALSTAFHPTAAPDSGESADHDVILASRLLEAVETICAQSGENVAVMVGWLTNDSGLFECLSAYHLKSFPAPAAHNSAPDFPQVVGMTPEQVGKALSERDGVHSSAPSEATRLVCLEAAQKLRTYVGIYTGDKQAHRLVDELTNIADALAAAPTGASK